MEVLPIRRLSNWCARSLIGAHNLLFLASFRFTRDDHNGSVLSTHSERGPSSPLIIDRLAQILISASPDVLTGRSKSSKFGAQGALSGPGPGTSPYCYKLPGAYTSAHTRWIRPVCTDHPLVPVLQTSAHSIHSQVPLMLDAANSGRRTSLAILEPIDLA